jgi:hypothetical protein
MARHTAYQAIEIFFDKGFYDFLEYIQQAPPRIERDLLMALKSGFDITKTKKEFDISEFRHYALNYILKIPETRRQVRKGLY